MTRRSLRARYRLFTRRPLSEDQRVCLRTFINLGPIAAVKELRVPVDRRMEEVASCSAFERVGDGHSATVNVRFRVRKHPLSPEQYHFTADEWRAYLTRCMENETRGAERDLKSEPFAIGVSELQRRNLPDLGLFALEVELLSVELDVKPRVGASSDDEDDD